MIAIRRILCPVDFSEYARRALDHAIVLARWYSAEIHVLHVYHTTPVAAGAPEMLPAMVLTPELRDELLASLKRFVADEMIEGVEMTFGVAEGAPARVIVEDGGSSHNDLIVLGTHGRSGFEHLVLGSVAERVLRHARCPVLIAPKHGSEAVPVPPPFKRILCGVDFSPSSMRALEYATSLAQEVDACLTVAHVFELEGAMPAQWRDMVTPDSIRRELLSVEQDRRDRLARTVAEGVDQFCKVERVMRGGTPYREILRLAAERQAELIVLGVHGRSALDVAFFGSTTNHVVRQATCPVLTVRGD